MQKHLREKNGSDNGNFPVKKNSFGLQGEEDLKNAFIVFHHTISYTVMGYATLLNFVCLLRVEMVAETEQLTCSRKCFHVSSAVMHSLHLEGT